MIVGVELWKSILDYNATMQFCKTFVEQSREIGIRQGHGGTDAFDKDVNCVGVVANQPVISRRVRSIHGFQEGLRSVEYEDAT